MTGWVVSIGYWLGWLVCTFWFARGFLAGQERTYPSLDIDNGDRALYLFLGAITAVIWPLAVPIRLAFQALVGRTNLLRTPREVAKRRERELHEREVAARQAEIDNRAERQRLEQVAREMDLPWV